MNYEQSAQRQPKTAPDYDAIVVGAGFSGLYMLYALRKMGLNAVVFETGSDVGGVWYWNGYPGARCDAESVIYCYTFSDELLQEWTWSERYPTQPEIQRYLSYVANRFDLRRDIRFETRVTEATFDDAGDRWIVATDRGDSVTARYLITAAGCLSTRYLPDFEGLSSFRGKWYHTGSWPDEEVDFSGLHVGVIGTGSSGIQCVPMIAQQAEHLTVFQRTPAFSTPARSGPLDPILERRSKQNYSMYREKIRRGEIFGMNDLASTPDELERAHTLESALAVSPEERERVYQRSWEHGGIPLFATFSDIITDDDANATLSEFIRGKIKETVKDPQTAERLCPYDYPYGAKRPCLDTNYYETFNRPNVSLVDLREGPIEAITETGIRTTNAEYKLDVIVFATGYDAVTGPLLAIDIKGVGGRPLKEKWADGPHSYLGLGMAGFPNLFTITGPGSPSILANVVTAAEQHVDWIAECIGYMRDHDLHRIDATVEAEAEWGKRVKDTADATVFSKGKTWWNGSNIPGRPKVFLPYAGGTGPYQDILDEISGKDYEGFALS